MDPGAGRTGGGGGVMRTYRYVRLSEVDRYLRSGWIPTPGLVDTHHGRWSLLMRACVCNPEGRADAR